MTFYTSKYQMKFGKCFECFTLGMRVYVGVQWSIELIVAKQHELNTWHGNRNVNKKQYEAT
jgi:hypothetical protein